MGWYLSSIHAIPGRGRRGEREKEGEAGQRERERAGVGETERGKRGGPGGPTAACTKEFCAQRGGD